MPTLEEIRARFTDEQRRDWEVDRILVQEDDRTGGSRFAVDLRAGYSAANIRMGAGSAGFVGPRYGKRTPVMEVFAGIGDAVADVVIERADLWGAALRNDKLVALLELPWFQGVRELNLGDNGLTKKGLDALFASAVGRGLRRLTLSYNRVGGAVAGVSGMAELTHLDLVYANVNGKALIKLGKAELPALTHLDLQAVSGSSTPNKLIMASKRADPIKDVTLAPADLAGFLGTPLAGRLEWLSLGSIAFTPELAAALGEAELPALEYLALPNTKLGNAGLVALAGGGGLTGLETLDLADALVPHYEPSGKRNEPAAESVAALRALGAASFAQHLSALVLDRTVVGAAGLTALLAGELPELTDLGLNTTQLDDETCRVLAGAQIPLTRLRMLSNKVTAAGIEALLEAPFADRLTQLALNHNPIRDAGCILLARSERLSSMARLAIGGTGATDDAVTALVEGPVLPHLVLLNLYDCRISDDAALLLAGARPPALAILAMGRCGLTRTGIEALEGLGLSRLHVEDQDPSNLPPKLIDNPGFVFEPLEVAPPRPKPRPVPAELRARHPHPNWTGFGSHPDWILVLHKLESGYRIGMAEAETLREVEPEPPVEGPYFSFDFSPDGRWCGVMAPYRGLYVIDTATGASTRLADSLEHQKAGLTWSGDRLVVMDCDTDGDWEGRVEVYAHRDGRWEREHQLGGFWVTRDSIEGLAGGRVIAVASSRGPFLLLGVRGGELRYLGRLPVLRPRFYEADGRTLLTIRNHTYELTNIDAALDAAFADGASPERLDLPREVWPR